MLKKHLLIVDDDQRIRKLLKKFLTNNGYRVSTAENSHMARKLLRQITFDILILDIMIIFSFSKSPFVNIPFKIVS